MPACRLARCWPADLSEWALRVHVWAVACVVPVGSGDSRAFRVAVATVRELHGLVAIPGVCLGQFDC